MDQSGAMMGGVTVVAINEGGAVAGSSSTDERGLFVLNGIAQWDRG